MSDGKNEKNQDTNQLSQNRTSYEKLSIYTEDSNGDVTPSHDNYNSDNLRKMIR